MPSPTTSTGGGAATTSVQNVPDNPFQNDRLPIWQGQPHPQHHYGHRREEPADPDSSSPETNQDQAYDYSYKSLNETPSSPDLVKRRLTAASIGSDVTKVTPNNVTLALPPSQPRCVVSDMSTPSSRGGDQTPLEAPEVIQVCNKDDTHAPPNN
jgi:hypothetical protein